MVPSTKVQQLTHEVNQHRHDSRKAVHVGAVLVGWAVPQNLDKNGLMILVITCMRPMRMVLGCGVGWVVKGYLHVFLV